MTNTNNSMSFGELINADVNIVLDLCGIKCMKPMMSFLERVGFGGCRYLDSVSLDRLSLDRNSDSRKAFRSIWLCSQQLTESIRPAIDQMAANESENNNPAKSFLPHVTLCSGDELSVQDCEAILALFNEFFPEGIDLQVKGFDSDARTNPPAQIFYVTKSLEDLNSLCLFQDAVKSRLGLNCDVNNIWLHTSMFYKTVSRPLHAESIRIAREGVQGLLGETIRFDGFAFTTGRAWNPDDVAKWENVEAKSFETLKDKVDSKESFYKQDQAVLYQMKSLMNSRGVNMIKNTGSLEASNKTSNQPTTLDPKTVGVGAHIVSHLNKITESLMQQGDKKLVVECKKISELITQSPYSLKPDQEAEVYRLMGKLNSSKANLQPSLADLNQDLDRFLIS